MRLHEEEDGKLFPDTNRARTVLDALLAEAARAGAEVVRRPARRRCAARGRWVRDRNGGTASVPGPRRSSLRRVDGRFRKPAATDSATAWRAGSVTGTSRRRRRWRRWCWAARRTSRCRGSPTGADADRRRRSSFLGSMLWTHFGISGPVALNASRHWHRARVAGRSADVLLNLCPGETFETLDAWFLEQERSRPKAMVSTALSARLPGAVAERVDCAGGTGRRHLAGASASGRSPAPRARAPRDSSRRPRQSRLQLRGGHLGRDPARGDRPARMESRACPRLFLVGEILDVDGRLGGFNFQWAWSSAWVAAQALARALSPAPPR